MSAAKKLVTRKNLYDAVKHLRRIRRTEKDRLDQKQKESLNAIIAELEKSGGTRHGLFSWMGWVLAWPFLRISEIIGYSDPEPECAKFTGKFDPAAASTLVSRAETLYARLCPLSASATLREWTDVLLVAAVVALGVRSYYLQPFKIPTNSMYPSLRGVVVTALDFEKSLPAQPQRIAEQIFFGRAYFEIPLPAHARLDINSLRQSGTWMFQKLHLRFVSNKEGLAEVRVALPTEMTPRDLLGSELMALIDHPEPRTLRFMVETGDHLFVNKILYHFRKPARGDSFVFRTLGLDTEGTGRPVTNPLEGSQFYIKRCVAVGGNTVRVDPPRLLINGEVAPEAVIQRVWLGSNPNHPDYNPSYLGYSFGKEEHRMRFLTESRPSYTLQPHKYWAMGDNSNNSLDSRLFGSVPLENVVGKAMVIYYPLNRFLKIID